MTPLDRVADRLDERDLLVGRRTNQLTARCPAHDDRNASLSVGVGNDDRALVHCHAGCPTADVLDALGLDVRDLFAEDSQSKPWTNAGMRRTGATFERDGRARLGGVRYMPGASNGTTKTLAAKGSTRDLWPDPATIKGSVLFVVEGEPDAVTGATLGLPTVAVPGVGKWRQDWAQRIAEGRDRVVVIPDADKPGRAAAQRTAAAIAEHCSDVRVLDLAPSRTDGFDLSDFAADATDDDERRRARELLLAGAELTDPLAPPPEPSRETGALLDDVAALLRRFIVFRDDDQLVTVALWIAHSHAIDAAWQTPYLSVLSAEKRSGKTRLLEVLHGLCARAEHASGASEAGLFQLVDQSKPTLLIDEVDAIFGSNTERTEALRGVINSGNRRGATVIRGDKTGEPRRYRTFCPKVLAGIETGRLPDTIRDRSIAIILRRKRPDAKVDRYLWRDVGADVIAMHDALAVWASAHAEPLAAARPDLPTQLDDRAAEGWEPLLAIADIGGWGQRARAAAVALAGEHEDDDESRGVRLLRDIRSVFTDDDVVFSADLATALNAIEEAPWGAWHDGAGLNQRDLARLLKPYEIRSQQVRLGDATRKGFRREQFADAWDRYVGSEAKHPKHPKHPNEHGAFSVSDAPDVSLVSLVSDDSPHAFNGQEGER